MAHYDHILLAAKNSGIDINDVELVVTQNPEQNYYPHSHGYEISKNWGLKIGDITTVGQVCAQQDEYLSEANFQHFDVPGVTEAIVNDFRAQSERAFLKRAYAFTPDYMLTPEQIEIKHG